MGEASYGRSRNLSVNWEFSKKKSSIERIFSWIGIYKKIFPKYEIKEISYLGVIVLAAITRSN